MARAAARAAAARAVVRVVVKAVVVRVAEQAEEKAAAMAAAKGAAAKGVGRATECTCSSHRHKVQRSRSSTRNPRRLVHSWGLQGHTFLTYS